MPSEMDLQDKKRNIFKWRYDRRSGNCNLSNCKLIWKQLVWDFNGIRNHGLCVITAVLYQLSYADSYIGSRQIGWVHSFHRLRWTPQSTNWPAPNVWVFMAQLVELCSAKEEAMGSNPVGVPKFFCVNLQLLKLQLPLWRSYLHLNLYFLSSDHLQKEHSNANIRVCQCWALAGPCGSCTCTFLSL